MAQDDSWDTPNESIIRDLEKQITQLKADLADLQEAYDKTMPGMIAKLAVSENADLKQDLAKFGGHTADCALSRMFKSIEYSDKGAIYKDTDGKIIHCTCGFAESLERWE